MSRKQVTTLGFQVTMPIKAAVQELAKRDDISVSKYLTRLVKREAAKRGIKLDD